MTWNDKAKSPTEMTREEKLEAIEASLRKTFKEDFIPPLRILKTTETKTINQDQNNMIVSENTTMSRPPALEKGEYPAVCIGIADIGTHTREGYQGAPSRDKREVCLSFAIPSETVTIDGEDLPRTISKIYTASLDERARLRQDLEAWRDKDFTEAELKGFELGKVNGVPCRLSIEHTANGNAKIAKVRAPKAKTQVPDSLTPWNFSFEDYKGEDLPEGMPNWISEEIRSAKEYAKFASAAPSAPPEGAELPGAQADYCEDVPF